MMMQPAIFLAHDSEFGAYMADDRLPLVRLRERRRELVMSLKDHPLALTRARIREISEVQQAIKAIEAVIAE
jgi:hypothetical protein